MFVPAAGNPRRYWRYSRKKLGSDGILRCSRVHNTMSWKAASSARGSVIQLERNGCRSHFTSLRVGREHAGLAAEAVARKLVEQKNQSQSAFGRLVPCVEIASRRGLVQRQAVVSKPLIENVVLGKPAVGTGIAPECNHFGSS